MPRIGSKRKHHELLAQGAPSQAPSSSHSFDLITKDPSAKQGTLMAKKKPKLLDFASLATTPASASPPAVTFEIPFKIDSAQLSPNAIHQILHGIELLPLSGIEEKARLARRYWRTKGGDLSNFVTIGVVCHIWKKLIPPKDEDALKASNPTPQTSTAPGALATMSAAKSPVENGAPIPHASNLPALDRYMVVVRLSDLKRTSICLALQPSLNSVPMLKFGSVLVVLNPSFQNALDGDGVVLQLEKASQLCVLGQSPEIGLCKYQQPLKRTKAPTIAPLKDAPSVSAPQGSEAASEARHSPAPKLEAVCPSFINALQADYCEFHMYEMVQESKSTRMVLNDAGGGALSAKAQKRERFAAAHHLSDGVYDLCDRKWKITERNVRIESGGDRLTGPSAAQVYVSG